MLKQNKGKLLLTSLLTLLPLPIGLCLKDKMPDTVPIHWGLDGKADGFGSPLTVFVLLPLFLLALHWLGIFVTFRDNRSNGQHKKILGMIFWFCPAISLLLTALIYGTMSGEEIPSLAFPLLLIGVTFILIGNYLPKCRCNHTIGIRIGWTLANEENWNATHRFGGKVYVAMGILCLPAAFLPLSLFPAIALVIILTAVLLPLIYSWQYHKKQVRRGEYRTDASVCKNNNKKNAVIASLGILAALTFCLVLCFTGNITVSFGEDSFTLQASYSYDPVIRYGDIDFVEYRESDMPDTRISGFGTPRLLTGWFRNEEFGDHTRYSYAYGGACVVLRVDGKVIVIGLKTDAETEAFYHELNSKINAQKEPPV